MRVRTELIAITILAACLTACWQGAREHSEAEQSAFGCFVDSIDTLQMEQVFHRLLDNETPNWKADLSVKQRYADTKDFAQVPLWFNRMGMSADVDLLLSHLRRELPLAGLDSTAFFVAEIAHDLNIVHMLAFDSLNVNINEVLPRLDYLLSKAYVRYCVGQRYGFLRPDKFFNRLEYKTNTDDKVYAQLFGYEVKAPDYNEAIGMLSSPDRMKFLYASSPHDEVFEALRNCIDTIGNEEQRRQIAVNIERCRWQLKQPEEEQRKVVVNIPSQQLWAVCPDSVLNMRICCGAVTNKSPLLSSLIGYMQVNPDWLVPQNIVKSDFLRHAGDSAYFARNRYYIVERNSGDTLNPADVTADEMETGRLRIGQKSGVGNSLGRIVFRFANDFGIYLHDTSNRRAFNNQQRTLSHGCIRVQKPFELACFLLPEADEWLLDRMRISMDMEPTTERGAKYLKEHADDERPLRLVSYQAVSPKVPVYIVYYTAYPNPETGRIEFWPDLYGYDKAMAAEMEPFLLKR